jgi:ribonuclease R
VSVMKGRVGEEFRGVVTGVTSFGLFVTLDALYVEGLIHVSELGAEYFQHNEIVHELRGERTGRRFRLYDPVSVLVSRVDLDARRIEFRLVPSLVRTTRKPRSEGPEEASQAVAEFDWTAADVPPVLVPVGLPGRSRKEMPVRPSRAGSASKSKPPKNSATKPAKKPGKKPAPKAGRTVSRGAAPKSRRRG